ncbi:hypothetical protein CRUP_022219, partial [Coryphaenoides rupestris]
EEEEEECGRSEAAWRVDVIEEGEDNSDSSISCSPIGHRTLSLSSLLTNDSAELCDLLILEDEEGHVERHEGRQVDSQEDGQEGTQVERHDDRQIDRQDDRQGWNREEQTDGAFVRVLADQMLMSGQTRSTEDLFAIIHRSKKKMLGRKTSYYPPPTPRPLHFRGQSSLSSFKALLLKTGSPACSSSRISAVERLCTSSSPISTHCTSSSHLESQGVNYPLAPDIPLSPVRRFAARYRHPASPLTVILEEEEEEEEEKEEEEEEEEEEEAEAAQQ